MTQSEYPEGSNAIAAIVLAAVSWFVFPFVGGVIAFFLARAEIKGIDAGRRDPSQRDTAQIAYWIAIANIVVSTIGCCVVFGFYGSIILVMLGLGTAASAR